MSRTKIIVLSITTILIAYLCLARERNMYMRELGLSVTIADSTLRINDMYCTCIYNSTVIYPDSTTYDLYPQKGKSWVIPFNDYDYFTYIRKSCIATDTIILSEADFTYNPFRLLYLKIKYSIKGYPKSKNTALDRFNKKWK